MSLDIPYTKIINYIFKDDNKNLYNLNLLIIFSLHIEKWRKSQNIGLIVIKLTQVINFFYGLMIYYIVNPLAIIATTPGIIEIKCNYLVTRKILAWVYLRRRIINLNAKSCISS